MSLTTRYPGEIVIANSPTNLVFGTVMLGNAYGEVESASVSREADQVVLDAAGGNILAVILQKLVFAFKFKVLFRADITPPDLADLIVFPLAGVSGRILPPISIEWEKAGHRMLSIEAQSWDSFAAVNAGAGNAYTYAGGVYTPKV
jgi:hypothetical protein